MLRLFDHHLRVVHLIYSSYLPGFRCENRFSGVEADDCLLLLEMRALRWRLRRFLRRLLAREIVEIGMRVLLNLGRGSEDRGLQGIGGHRGHRCQ